MKIKTLFSASLSVALASFGLVSSSFAKSDDLLGNLGIEVDPNTSNCFVARLGQAGCDDAACEATVGALDSFCVEVEWDSLCVDEAWDFCELDGEINENATFSVSKSFQDGNPATVPVSITCNSGLPLEQSFDISESRGVAFVLTSFNSGDPDCTIVEETPAGYEANYIGGDNGPSADGCEFLGVQQGDQLKCLIENNVVPVTVTVAATWPVPAFPSDVAQVGSVSLDCSNVAGGENYWEWDVDGEGSFEAEVLPSYDGSTECTVAYSAEASAVEASGCEEPIQVNTGDAETGCTVEFTVFFEGIPTLDSYGLAVMALLFLGVGFVGFRRFI